MSPPTKIAIAGFTGKMARLITSSLLTSHPTVQIHGISRSPSKLDTSTRSNPNIKLFQAESTDSPALRRAVAGTSACICCYLGDDTLMVDGQKTLIDACIAEGVPRYIASDWSLDFSKLAYGDHPRKDPMKYVQAYLDEKEREGRIKGVHVLNGAFTEVVWAPYLGWVDAKEGVFRYYGTGDEKIEMTTMKDVARFTAEVAVDPNANGFLRYLGDSKSIKELAQLYQKVYGVEPKIEHLGSLQDLYNTMTALFKQPDNPYGWIGMYYQYYMQNGQTVLGKTDNERYPGLVRTSVEEFLKMHTRESVGNSGRF